MLELLICIILLSWFSGAVLLLRYWYALILSKERYTRDELVDFLNIFMDEQKRLLGSESPLAGIITLGIGVFCAIILTWFGGIISPNLTGASDYAEAQYPNYFFQSFLAPLVLHFVWPTIKDIAVDQGGGPGSFVHKLALAEVPFFFGLCTGLATANFTAWGYHHEMSFLYCLINSLLCLGYAGYRLHTSPNPDELLYEESGLTGGGGVPEDPDDSNDDY